MKKYDLVKRSAVFQYKDRKGIDGKTDSYELGRNKHIEKRKK